MDALYLYRDFFTPHAMLMHRFFGLDSSSSDVSCETRLIDLILIHISDDVLPISLMANSLSRQLKTQSYLKKNRTESRRHDTTPLEK